MERLTEKRDGQNVIPLRQNGKIKWAICSARLGDAPTKYLYGDHADRLAAYEDTGLEPEEIELLAKQRDLYVDACGELPLKRIRELAQADREGRCVVLPDKTKTPTLERGTPVWYVDYENKNTESGKIFLASYKEGKLDSFSVDFDCGDFDEFIGSAWGNCFFGSKEQAETALKAREQERTVTAIT